MKVFISWSGELSKELGEGLRNWLPAVLQNVQPYFTPDDLEKGTRWGTEITRELDQSNMGIICLTRQNLESAWIMFEAGALSKKLDKSRVCPILFGVENADLKGPLVQFQATPFNQVEMRKLVKALNDLCGSQKLSDSVREEVFAMWWPKLETQVGSILAAHKGKANPAVRSEREMVEEILSLVRLLAREKREVELHHRQELLRSLVGSIPTAGVPLAALMQYFEEHTEEQKLKNAMDQIKKIEDQKDQDTKT